MSQLINEKDFQCSPGWAGGGAKVNVGVCHWSLMRRECHTGQSAVTGCDISPDATVMQHMNFGTYFLMIFLLLNSII